MVLRLVYKRGLLPISVRTFVLNAIAFAGVLSILIIGLKILHPLHTLRPSPPRANIIRDRSFVVLSVDDFGRWTDSVPLFPNSSFMTNHSSLIIPNNFWYRRATVETHHDLTDLHHALEHLNANVSFEQRAVLTPHWIVGGPDFGAMRAAGCAAPLQPPSAAAPLSNRDLVSDRLDPVVGPRLPSEEHADQHPSSLSFRQNARDMPSLSVKSELSSDPRHQKEGEQGEEPSLDFDACVYKEQLLSDAGPTGLNQKPYERGDLRDSYKALWKSGLWHPEYHGRSHFSVSKWLKLLRTDPKTQACFINNLVCATDTTQLRSEFNGFSDKSELKTWLEDGVNAFSSFWGYRPALISSPHNTWSTWLTDVAVDLSFLGAELAEDQANYVQHDNALSLHDRYRFDVFFPGFKCDRAIEEVMELLRVPVEKSLLDRWYEFLSMIDLFRVHHRPYHHGIGGDHKRFISLMWHAQNAMSSTYSLSEHAEHMLCLEQVIRAIREQRPRAVFVTGSELHQIRTQGWSQEVWSDSIVLRNYGTRPVEVEVPDLRELYPQSASWRGKVVFSSVVSQAGGKVSSRNSVNGKEAGEKRGLSVGDQFLMEPDSVVKLTIE